MKTNTKNIIWYKVLDLASNLKEGRVMTVSAGNTEIALTHYNGKFSALDN